VTKVVRVFEEISEQELQRLSQPAPKAETTPNR